MSESGQTGGLAPANHLTMGFRIRGLEAEQFRALFDLSDAELKARGMVRKKADSFPGFPCRVTLEDAQPGEELLLLNYAHHDVASPYRGSSPIFVRKIAKEAASYVNALPESVKHRLISLRGYDAEGMMRECEALPGSDAPGLIEKWFADPAVAYIHIHNARPGCFACVVERA